MNEEKIKNAGRIFIFDKDEHSDTIPTSKRPVRGVLPKKLFWEFTTRDRFKDVCGAIERAFDAGEKIRIEWVEEYNELIDKLKEYEDNN